MTQIVPRQVLPANIDQCTKISSLTFKSALKRTFAHTETLRRFLNSGFVTGKKLKKYRLYAFSC